MKVTAYRIDRNDRETKLFEQDIPLEELVNNRAGDHVELLDFVTHSANHATCDNAIINGTKVELLGTINHADSTSRNPVYREDYLSVSIWHEDEIWAAYYASKALAALARRF